ncbi:MAG: hypothetical protein K6C06_00455 [Lachnospiraceae bacterium]|nr:hypothetical protein [Lachnospiraceae bacterium]
MTLNGAIKQLHELRSAEDMPFYYKPAIAEVINVLLMDAREVKRGRWIQSDMDDGFVTCSYCKEHRLDGRMALRPDYATGLNFCSNCGADMRKGKEE